MRSGINLAGILGERTSGYRRLLGKREVECEEARRVPLPTGEGV